MALDESVPVKTIQGQNFSDTLRLPNVGQIYSPAPTMFLEPSAEIRESEFRTLAKFDMQYPLSIAAFTLLITHVVTQTSSETFWQFLSYYILATLVMYIIEEHALRSLLKHIYKTKESTLRAIEARFTQKEGRFVAVQNEKRE